MVPDVFRVVFLVYEYHLVRRLQTSMHVEPKYLTNPVPCSFSVGTAGPAFFSLGIRDSIVIIVVVNLV